MDFSSLVVWAGIAGVISGVAAIIAILKDLRLLPFRRANTFETEVRTELSQTRRLDAVTSVILGTVAADEMLHHHSSDGSPPPITDVPNVESSDVDSNLGDGFDATGAEAIADTASTLLGAIRDFFTH